MKKQSNCWENTRCNNTECAAYQNPGFLTGLRTVKNPAGAGLIHCIDCDEFINDCNKEDLSILLRLTSRIFKSKQLKSTKNEVEKLGLELSIGFSDCFEMLKKLSLGDPTARITINTDNWLLKKLEGALNKAGESIERFINQTHEMAIGLCEHYDTLSRLASGDRSARASENSQNELISKLGMLINQEASALTQKIKESEKLNRQLEQGLREQKKANDKLKELDRQKSDFLSMVSHELRTPLTSILGFAKIINKKFANIILPQLTVEDEKVLKAIKQIHQNINIIVSEGDRLTALINNVLDLAKIEAGRIDLNFIPTSISEVVEQSIRAISAIFESKGITIKKHIQDPVPTIHADKDRLIQVMINLLSNAAKFTDHGEVTCTVTHNNRFVTVSVADTGVGIASAKIKHIFDRFEQGVDTLTGKPQGSGLGLAICKHIIESHSGKIWAESAEGKGSTFIFSLPVMSELSMEITSIDHEVTEIVRQLKDHVEIIHPVQAKGKKVVMIIDDDEHIRELLRQELEASGYKIMESEDGLDAIQKLHKKKPHLIILDIMMPKINGYDTAAVIRNNPDTKNIPIIILSILEDAERGYRLGVDRYFTKPVDTKSLINEIDRLISQGETKKKILIVDESESAVKSLAEVLETKGYTVGKAFSGREAVRVAKEMKPNLIIIDALLKERNEITKAIRFEKGLENVCFILLGAHNEN
ncbi:MAG: response regulator [Spirochaetales bacterium]|nr:response regulator [Spirochaetales bacterium]